MALIDSWRGKGQIAFRTQRGSITGWCALDGTDTRGLDDFEVGNIRPLVVIDPEDPDAVERLAALLWPHYDDASMAHLRKSEVTADALREFANPKPPRPAEPMGLGAVVEDADGRLWVRAGHSHTDPNWRVAGSDEWTGYADVRAVKVLSVGVTS
jgi:hypothetical protein